MNYNRISMPYTRFGCTNDVHSAYVLYLCTLFRPSNKSKISTLSDSIWCVRGKTGDNNNATKQSQSSGALCIENRPTSESGFGKIHGTQRKNNHVDEHRTHTFNLYQRRVFASDARIAISCIAHTQFYKSVRMSRRAAELIIAPISRQRIRNNSMRTWLHVRRNQTETQ